MMRVELMLKTTVAVYATVNRSLIVLLVQYQEVVLTQELANQRSGQMSR